MWPLTAMVEAKGVAPGSDGALSEGAGSAGTWIRGGCAGLEAIAGGATASSGPAAVPADSAPSADSPTTAPQSTVELSIDVPLDRCDAFVLGLREATNGAIEAREAHGTG